MRIYQGDSVIPGDTRPHTFVEIERDGFIEIDLPILTEIDKGLQQRLRAFTRRTRADEKKTNTYHIRITTRYFQMIRPIPNLKLIGTF